MKKSFLFILCVFLFSLAIGFSACSKTHTEHVFSEWTTVTAPSCLMDGLQKRVCECGQEETQVLPATGHTEVTDAAVSATCTATGLSEGLHCSVCGVVLIEQTVTSKLPHAYEDGVCINCGEHRSTVGLEFTLKNDNTYEVSGYSGTDPIIIIPSVYNDKNVTSIGNNAFLENYSILSVTIPSTITKIGENAFYNCIKLYEVYNKSSLPLTKESGSSYGFVTHYAKTVFTSKYTSFITVTENGFYYYKDGTTVYLVGYDGNESVITLPEEINFLSDYALAACAKITEVVIPEKFKAIPEGMFFDCEELTKVTLGREVNSIGDGAFCECKKLSDINIYQTKITSLSDYVFSDCTGLEKAVIPEKVTVIGENAFNGCSNLIEVNIPDGVTTIKSQAFYSCVSLPEIFIPKSVTTLGDKVFAACRDLSFVSLGRGLVSISENMFSSCKNLTEISIPDNITSIQNGAFSNCYRLSRVEFGSGVTSIGSNAFAKSGLITITIPDNVQNIEQNAFDDCYKLVEVYNLSSLNITKGSDGNGKVGFYAKDVYTENTSGKLTITDDGFALYQNNGKMAMVAYIGDDKEITVPNGVTSINQYAFYNSAQTKVTLPESVTTIASYAFFENSCITTIDIPDSVTSIGIFAFAHCSALKNVTIGKGLTSLSQNLFYYSSGLESLTIPGNITNIGPDAFAHCPAEIIWEEPTITTIQAHSFSSYMGASFTIPDTVTTIEEDAFSNSSIQKISFGANVKTIENGAFFRCAYLTKLDYTGDLTSWLNISFASQLSNPLYYTQDLYIKNELVTDIVIPNTVTQIPNYAFIHWLGTSLVIGDNVTEIGEAFESCPNLLFVTLGEKVNRISDYSFLYCSSLYKVYNKSSLTITPGSEANGFVGYYALEVYTDESFVSDITVTPDGFVLYANGDDLVFLNYIGDESEITIPENVTKIHKNALTSNRIVTSIIIPNGVTTIGYEAFSSCYRLKNISIPNSVTVIEESALSATVIEELILPEGLEDIPDWAFSFCYNLTTVHIPESVKRISSLAFYASNLSTVYYGGTTEQWQKINIESGGVFDTSYTITVICSD